MSRKHVSDTKYIQIFIFDVCEKPKAMIFFRMIGLFKRNELILKNYCQKELRNKQSIIYIFKKTYK
jgi:hypothetical protein